MGLNRVSNPRKLRRLASLVGEPVERAYARYFTGHDLLVFGVSGRQYAVAPDDSVEPYAEEPPLRLVEAGIGGGGRPVVPGVSDAAREEGSDDGD